MLKYQPKHSKRQVIVEFKIGFGREFARNLGQSLGCKLLDYSERGSYYLFETAKGKEQEAIENFQKYPDFVDWADFRDLRLEQRARTVESIVNKLRDLEPTQPEEQYQQEIQQIIKDLEKLKEI